MEMFVENNLNGSALLSLSADVNSPSRTSKYHLNFQKTKDIWPF